MEKSKTEKWWSAGLIYENDLKKKLLKEGCGAAKRMLIECKNRSKE